jgi:hypothetical protein
LTDQHEYFNYKTNNSVSHERYGDGWFYQTLDQVEESTGMARRVQDKCIGNLVKCGFIEVAVFISSTKNIPNRHFRINEQKILEFFNPQRKNEHMCKKDKCICTHETGKCICAKTPKANVQNAHMLPYSIITNLNDQPKNLKGSNAPLRDAPLSANATPEIDDPEKWEWVNETKPEVEPVSKPKLVERAKNVKTTDEEHAKIVAKHGKEVAEESYVYLSEWKDSATPAQVKKHSSDYFRIMKWVAIQVKETSIRDSDLTKKQNMSKIAPHRKGNKLSTPGDLEDDNFQRRRL